MALLTVDCHIETLLLYSTFPLLARDDPRDTTLPIGDGVNVNGDKPIHAPAGMRVVADIDTM